MSKYTVTKKADIGSKGPGLYTLDQGKKDAKGRPFREVHLVTGEGKTEQSHKKECDMNYILRNYQKTGLITHAKKYSGQYDDVSVQDFNDAMMIVTEAQNMYRELPSNIRERFKGPEQFLQFVNNPGNKAEMQKLGILKGNDGLKEDGITASGAPVETPDVSSVPENPPA